MVKIVAFLLALLFTFPASGEPKQACVLISAEVKNCNISLCKWIKTQGTGVIVAKQGNAYLALTNWHTFNPEFRNVRIKQPGINVVGSVLLKEINHDLAAVAFIAGQNLPHYSPGGNLQPGDAVSIPHYSNGDAYLKILDTQVKEFSTKYGPGGAVPNITLHQTVLAGASGAGVFEGEQLSGILWGSSRKHNTTSVVPARSVKSFYDQCVLPFRRWAAENGSGSLEGTSPPIPSRQPHDHADIRATVNGVDTRVRDVNGRLTKEIGDLNARINSLYQSSSKTEQLAQSNRTSIATASEALGRHLSQFEQRMDQFSSETQSSITEHSKGLLGKVLSMVEARGKMASAIDVIQAIGLYAIAPSGIPIAAYFGGKALLGIVNRRRRRRSSTSARTRNISHPQPVSNHQPVDNRQSVQNKEQENDQDVRFVEVRGEDYKGKAWEKAAERLAHDPQYRNMVDQLRGMAVQVEHGLKVSAEGK